MYLIACETTAAITTHAREVIPANPVSYSGSNGKTKTLCGSRVGWDLQYTGVENIRCRDCIDKVSRREVGE